MGMPAQQQKTFGQNLLTLATNFESRLYGFTTKHQRVGAFTYEYWDSSDLNKPPLILIHGFTADKMVWLRCARYLKKSYRVIVPDIAGHGATEFISGQGYGIPKQAERLHYFIKQLQLPSVPVIAGNSMGGFLAAQYARVYPNDVNKIICVDPAGIVSPEKSTSQKLAEAGDNPFLMDDIKAFPRFYDLTMAKPPYLPKVIKTTIAHKYVERKADFTEIFQDFFAPEDMLNGKLHEISCPVLLLWGAKDQLIHISAADVWQNETNGISVIWDDLGHMPMMEAPKLCAQEMLRFLQASA